MKTCLLHVSYHIVPGTKSVNLCPTLQNILLVNEDVNQQIAVAP
jgi:siroheme synthase